MKGLISVLLTLTGLCVAGKLPTDFKTCHDPESINDCLKNSINEVIPQLKNGIASLKVPSLDPLFIPSMVIGEVKGAIHLIQDFKNINMKGASKSVVKKLDGSGVKNYIIKAQTFTPALSLEADYTLVGRLLLIPIQGKGKCVITLQNVTVNHISRGERITKKGQDYMKVTNYTITLHPQKMTYDFEHLFGEDKHLGMNVNQILNENWKQVFDDVRPSYEKSLGIIFGDYANKIYTQVPLTELFGI